MTEIQWILSENMRSLRKCHKLSQTKLAEMINSAANYISQIEQGKKFPSPTKLEQIASALNVKAFELFYPPDKMNQTLMGLEQDLQESINQLVAMKFNKFRSS